MSWHWHRIVAVSTLFALVSASIVGCVRRRPPIPSDNATNDQENGGEDNAANGTSTNDGEGGANDSANGDNDGEGGDDNGTSGDCPVAQARVGDGAWAPTILVQPDDDVELRAANLGEDVDDPSYQWTLLDAPVESTATLTPGATDPEPELQVDAIGSYTVELFVSDSGQFESCDPATVTIDAADLDEELHIQLSWESPAVEEEGGPDRDAAIGTDLGAHYARTTDEWATSDAVWWLHAEQNWGSEGTARLDLDDQYGVGPENISHSGPAPGERYSYGVHYYCDNDYGESIATVAVFFDGVLQAEYEKTLDAPGDFWHVGDVVWSNSPEFDFVDDEIEEVSGVSNCGTSG